MTVVPVAKRKSLRINEVRLRSPERVLLTMRRWEERYLRRVKDVAITRFRIEYERSSAECCAYAYFCWYEAQMPEGTGVFIAPEAAKEWVFA